MNQSGPKRIVQIEMAGTVRLDFYRRIWPIISAGYDLDRTCAELDAADIPTPRNWRTGRTPSISTTDTQVYGWVDALELGFRSLAWQQISYYRRRVRDGYVSVS